MEDKEKVCCMCDEPIEDDDFVEHNGEIYCTSCFEDNFVQCESCERWFSEDEMTWWGEIFICPECLDSTCPCCNEEENKQKTQAVYDAMREKYIGRKTDLCDEVLDCSWDADDDFVLQYSASITIDENGRIADISRISCEVMLSEALTSSNWRPYPVSNKDYEYFIQEEIEPILVGDEDEEHNEF